MHIRLHGTPAENRTLLAILGEVLDIRCVSKSYRDRPQSAVCRVYIERVSFRQEVADEAR